MVKKDIVLHDTTHMGTYIGGGVGWVHFSAIRVKINESDLLRFN
jgi:hypothetical protein